MIFKTWQRPAAIRNRWLQLIVGIVAMVAIANLQYGWTLFVGPINHQHHWGKAAIQVAFTAFVLAETWPVPLEAYFVDRYGPRLIVAIGGILVGLSWVIDSMAGSLALLYAGGTIGGIGAGIVYSAASGAALKWFPDRRGLGSGLTAAGYGAGSALTIIPIAKQINASGYQSAFLTWGIIQGVVVVICAFLMRVPQKEDLAGAEEPSESQTARDFRPTEMLKNRTFYLLYIMMTMVAMGGLMISAQLGPIAKDFNVADSPISLLGFTMAALPFALSLDRTLDGLGRPFFGWVSDHFGRENTMSIAFGLDAAAIFLLITFARSPILFVIFSGLTFFGWGEIYSLFPATCGDLFGRKFATTNYGLLYTAKGAASLLVPVSNLIAGNTGNWYPVFMLAVAFNSIAALLALFVLKRRRNS